MSFAPKEKRFSGSGVNCISGKGEGQIFIDLNDVERNRSISEMLIVYHLEHFTNSLMIRSETSSFDEILQKWKSTNLNYQINGEGAIFFRFDP